MTPLNESPVSQPPKDFFDDASFKTLYGGVVITWIATSAIADVWGEVDLKILGFTIALIVALLGFFLSEQRTLKKLVITPFNGLLIYLTIMGGTSFLPADINRNQPAAGTDTTQTEVADVSDSVPERSAFVRAWNPNNNLVRETVQLKKENEVLEDRTEQLEQVNTAYKTQLESTRQVIRELQISPAVREDLMRNLDVSRNATLLNSRFNQ